MLAVSTRNQESKCIRRTEAAWPIAEPMLTISMWRRHYPHARSVLRVSQDDDDGVIRVDDDPIRRTAPLGVLSGAVVGVVTALPSG